MPKHLSGFLVAFVLSSEKKVYTTTPEVTEQRKLWCIPFSWENKGKKGIHHRSGKKGIHHTGLRP